MRFVKNFHSDEIRLLQSMKNHNESVILKQRNI